MKRPRLDELFLAPKLSKPDSLSRSLPVKCMGLGSDCPEHVSQSPNERLVQVSYGPPVAVLRARSVPNQSAWMKYVVPVMPLPRQVVEIVHRSRRGRLADPPSTRIVYIAGRGAGVYLLDPVLRIVGVAVRAVVQQIAPRHRTSSHPCGCCYR